MATLAKTLFIFVFSASVLAADLADVWAKDFGVFGETWEIKEPDAVEEIQNKIESLEKSGKIQEHNNKITEQTKKKVNRPAPVLFLKHTVTPRVYNYDPSFSHPVDLKDQNGQIFYKAGTLINPLDYVTLRYELLFLDGDDKKQVAWAVAKHKEALVKPLLILIKGEPLKLSETHKTEFYFDQFGEMSKKFGLKQIPALVKQEGKTLLIQEIKLSEVS